MKTLKICLLFIVLTFSASAQSNENRYEFSTHFSTNYSYRRLEVEQAGYAANLAIAEREQQDAAMFGFVTGFSFSYFFVKQLSFGLGFDYSKNNYTTTRLWGGPGNIIPYEDRKTEVSTSNYFYASIPLRLNVVLGQKKIKFIASAGIAPSLLMFRSSSKDNSIATGKVFNLFASGAAGIEFALGKKMGIRVQPVFRYGLLKMPDGIINEHLYDAGLDLGWTYKF